MLVMIATLVGNGQALGNLDVCQLTTDSRSLRAGYGTGLYRIGKFPIDDFNEVTSKTFHYETDGRSFDIMVEIEYGYIKDVEKGKPTSLRLSLLARNSSEKGNVSLLPVEANADYHHKWGRLSVETTIVNGDAAQRFGLSCSDGLAKKGLTRNEPWLKKTRTGGSDQ